MLSPVVMTALVPPMVEKVMVAAAPGCVTVGGPIVVGVHPRGSLYTHPPFPIHALCVVSTRRGRIVVMVLDDAPRCIALDVLLIAIFGW